MKIDRICFEQLFPTGVYANQRLRAEATIEDGENPIVGYVELQAIVEASFTTLNPQIQWQHSESDIKAIIDYPAKEKTEIAIDNCTSISELNSLNADALKYGLVEQFVDKIKTFQ